MRQEAHVRQKHIKGFRKWICHRHEREAAYVRAWSSGNTWRDIFLHVTGGDQHKEIYTVSRRLTKGNIILPRNILWINGPLCGDIIVRQATSPDRLLVLWGFPFPVGWGNRIDKQWNGNWIEIWYHSYGGSLWKHESLLVPRIIFCDDFFKKGSIRFYNAASKQKKQTNQQGFKTRPSHLAR